MRFTYSSLKTAIQNYTENDETTFTSNLDNFIKNAEELILKKRLWLHQLKKEKDGQIEKTECGKKYKQILE